MRKYRSADAFSDQRQRQLAALEQRLAQLDTQLSSVETLIEQRFPDLGLSLVGPDGVELSLEVAVSGRRLRRSKPR
jgi:hypothetical protein